MARQVGSKFKVIGEHETTKGERLRLKISADENRLRLEIIGGRWVSKASTWRVIATTTFFHAGMASSEGI